MGKSVKSALCLLDTSYSLVIFGERGLRVVAFKLCFIPFNCYYVFKSLRLKLLCGSLVVVPLLVDFDRRNSSWFFTVLILLALKHSVLELNVAIYFAS